MGKVKKGKSRLPGKVRIGSGRLRGSVLEVASMEGLRPTSSRMRETLFNWLQAVIPGARCLDLFAGTGALGIEALSRGAQDVLFVEKHPRLAQALENNVQRLKQTAVVHHDDALAYLSQPPACAFDVVFMDPPFEYRLWDKIAERLEEGYWLKPHAHIYVEIPKGYVFQAPIQWQPVRQSHAGDVTGVLYYR